MRLAFLTVPALLAGIVPATAQQPPANPNLPFASALQGYQRHADQEVAPWQQSNDTVGRIGGWRAYAREAAGQGSPAPAATPAAAPRPVQPSAPQPQGGHRHH